MLVGVAHADDKALKPYVGKLVISPDEPPATLDELPAFLKANLTKDSAYDLIKGPPWPFHLVAVLPKDYKTVTLVVTDTDPKHPDPLLAIAMTPASRIVIAHVEATEAAGFANEKTYRVQLRAGSPQRVVAKCQLKLRP
jgi:hypothetical protein